MLIVDNLDSQAVELSDQFDSIPPELPTNASNSKVNAVIVILCRNSDLNELTHTLQNFNRAFNLKYKYPFVFLNDKNFTDEFKNTVNGLIPYTDVKFGLVQTEHWSYPQWIDQDRARQSRFELETQQVPYAASESYRHMCRYFSGFFFHHPLLQQYDYYWRVEPGVSFTCDIPYDPFEYMVTHKKLYGFVVAIYEIPETIATLWSTVKSYMKQYPSDIPSPNMLDFIHDKEKNDYNGCHYWSNFEIASFKLWRNEKYQRFFDYLDANGGFFYERWGDAPVHSIAASLFLSPSEVHYFNNIGYNHPPYQYCPDPSLRLPESNCQCHESVSYERKVNHCLNWYKNAGGAGV
ncbi:nucleotide-diphospho-sugar transferase [Paraphysoderma sedebokerense]|nr:nucleotide-diphospho-sugar transferase [Paraphysoderma sedebokerense]